MAHISLHPLSVIFGIIFIVISIGIRSVTSHNMESELCGGDHNNVTEGICWELQHPLNEIKLNDSCKITRVTDVTSNEVKDKEGEIFVLDPCKREENRRFMECVLDYVPDITEDDPGYNQGRCQCYKNWSKKGSRHPAYNHTWDPEKDAKDWFVYSDEFHECVVKYREQCALAVSISAPYRCQSITHHGHKMEGKCFEIGQDPRFKICTNGKGGHERGGLTFIMSMSALVAFLF